MVWLLFLGYLYSVGLAEQMKGFLFYEDQKEDICGSFACQNFLTLKKQIHATEKKMEDFTVCFRFNLLSYRAKNKESYLFAAGTDKRIMDTSGNEIEINLGCQFCLYTNDGPGNGAVLMKPNNDKIMEILEGGGTTLMFPIYEEPINAYEWNSICLGSNLKDKYLFIVRNGKTQMNMSMPQVWADVNVGLDTSAFTPFQVTRYSFDIKIDSLCICRQRDSTEKTGSPPGFMNGRVSILVIIWHP